MTLLVLLACAYASYTFIGAVVLTVVDSHRGALLRWYDGMPPGTGVIFWLAWPLYVTRFFIHDERKS
jgi:hypothetical protein